MPAEDYYYYLAGGLVFLIGCIFYHLFLQPLAKWLEILQRIAAIICLLLISYAIYLYPPVNKELHALVGSSQEQTAHR